MLIFANSLSCKIILFSRFLISLIFANSKSCEFILFARVFFYHLFRFIIAKSLHVSYDIILFVRFLISLTFANSLSFDFILFARFHFRKLTILRIHTISEAFDFSNFREISILLFHRICLFFLFPNFPKLIILRIHLTSMKSCLKLKPKMEILLEINKHLTLIGLQNYDLANSLKTRKSRNGDLANIMYFTVSDIFLSNLKKQNICDKMYYYSSNY